MTDRHKVVLFLAFAATVIRLMETTIRFPSYDFGDLSSRPFSLWDDPDPGSFLSSSNRRTFHFGTTKNNKLAQCFQKGSICGNKCNDYGTCQCGNDGNFGFNDGYYCCIPQDSTCRIAGWNVMCSDGKKLPLNKFCQWQGSCPISSMSSTAVASNCTNGGEKNCPYSRSSKVCKNDKQSRFKDHCGMLGGKACEKPFGGGLNYNQCYQNDKLLPDKITCLSRMDGNKNIFDNKETRQLGNKKKRWNFFAEIEIENGQLNCKHENYSIDDLCHKIEFDQMCTFKDDISYQINPGRIENKDLCHDYSFWQPGGRCSSTTGKSKWRTHPVLCDRDQTNCTQTWSNKEFVIHEHVSYCQSTANESNCISTGKFFCNKSLTCIPLDKKCDGIVHCIEGDDESFEICKNEYPKEATIQCIENRLGYDIIIKATPCNGVKECRDGSDEKCEEDKLILVGIVAILLILTNVIYHYLKWYRLEWKDQVFQEASQNSTNYGSYLIGDDLAKLKNDTTQTECAKLLKGSPGSFAKLKDASNRLIFNKWTENIMNPLLIVWTQMDPIKDLILATRMSIILGGPLIIITNPQLFSSCVVMLFYLSIFGPQFLGTLRIAVSNTEAWKDWQAVICTIIFILLSPIHMYVEHFKLAYMELKLKISPTDMSLIEEKERMKRALHMHVKLELGLETVYQLAGQLILLLMAYTKTPTQSGLEAMFRSGEGLEPKTLFFLVTSILLSFHSCIKSHWKALTACREHFPFKSRLISGLYSLFCCLIRVTAIISFFAGPLGLFDLLRHLQAEQFPWDPNILDLVNPDGTMVLGNNPSFKWNSVDRWKKNGPLFLEHESGALTLDQMGQSIPNARYFVSAPDYTFYVSLQLGYYLMIFIGCIGMQTLVIFIAKCILSKVFWHEFNILEKFLHSLENSNIPYNAKEWDDGKGDAKEHKNRMKSNWFEVLSVIIINGIFNSILLLSLGYLIYKMQERHDVLSQTIGFLKEEQEALNRGYYLFFGSLALIIFGSLLEAWFFWLYNGSWHPFANILKDPSDANKYSMTNDVKTLSRKMKNVTNGSLFLSDDPKEPFTIDLTEDIISVSDMVRDVKSLPRKMNNIVNGSLFFCDEPSHAKLKATHS